MLPKVRFQFFRTVLSVLFSRIHRTFIGYSVGICGSTRLADVGGVPYLVPGPAAWRERTYNFNHVAKQTDVPGAHVLGACAGSKHYVQVNSGKYY